MQEHFVIYSLTEWARRGGHGYWSTSIGWTSLDGATRFSLEERARQSLPEALNQDVGWIALAAAQNHQGSLQPEEVAVFREKLCRCLAAVSEDVGCRVRVFIRDGAILVMREVRPEAIDLAQLGTYEMLIIEGMDRAGDHWEHVFFPLLLSDHFECNAERVPEPRRLAVSLDGGATFRPAPSGVRIVYADVAVNDAEGFGEVHINATHEGVTTKVWTGSEHQPEGPVVSEERRLDDIVSDLVQSVA